MGSKKRKQDSDGEEESDRGAFDSGVQLKKSAKSKQSASGKEKTLPKPKTAKKPKFDDSGDESLPAEEGKRPTVRVFKNAEGEKYVELGKKKRAAVRSFKGQVFVDIREFYGTDGEEKPGKKGISLTIEQWEVLKRSINTIDSFFAEHNTQ